MSEIFGKVMEELKSVPITMMFMVGLYALVGYLIMDHVSKADFLELKNEITGVQHTLMKDHADSRLRSIEQELFNLNQHMSDEKNKGHDVDELYHRRIDELNHQREKELREIDLLDHSSGSITEAQNE